MKGLTVRWSLADAPQGVEAELATYVEGTSHAKFTGMSDLRFKTWRMRAGEWFEGCYVFATDEARAAFQETFTAGAAEALRLLRPGGVVAFDNALWHDRVADPAQRDEETVAIRELGRTVAAHDGLLSVLLPVGDGLLCAKKVWSPDDED